MVKLMDEDIAMAEGRVVTGVVGSVLVVFLSIAMYNVLELSFIVTGYFKRHSGLYFWTFVVATYGILIYSIGFLLKAKVPSAGGYFYSTFIVVGWVAMVTGQSLVLWSRLHLVLRSRRKQNFILYMIIFDAITMHIPIGVMVYGSNSNNPGPWVKPYTIFEKVQVTVFFIQETIISFLYIFETSKLARLQAVLQSGRRSHRLMRHLIAVNLVIIILDITILALEYANYYTVQTSYKALVYSVKLKMEFTILNKIKEMVSGKNDPDSGRRGEARWPFGPKRQGGTSNCAQTDPGPNGFDGLASFQGSDISYHVTAHSEQISATPADLERQLPDETRNLEHEVVLTTEVVVEREKRPESDEDSGRLPGNPFEEGSSGTKDTEKSAICPL